MTPERFREIRETAGLSLAQIAQLVRISNRASVHRWEKGDRAISGPVAIITEMLAAGELPARYSASSFSPSAQSRSTKA